MLATSGCSSLSRSVEGLSSSLVSWSGVSLLESDSSSLGACLSCLLCVVAGVTGAVGGSRCSVCLFVGGVWSEFVLSDFACCFWWNSLRFVRLLFFFLCSVGVAVLSVVRCVVWGVEVWWGGGESGAFGILQGVGIL